MGGLAGRAVNEVLLLMHVDHEATSSWVWFSRPTALMTSVLHGTQFGKGQKRLVVGRLGSEETGECQRVGRERWERDRGRRGKEEEEGERGMKEVG